MIIDIIYTKIENCILKYKNRIRKFCSKHEYVPIGKSLIHSTANIMNSQNFSIGLGSEIKEYVIIQVYNGSISIGNHCQINPFTVIYGGDIRIGNNVIIAPHCMIVSGNHDYKQTIKPMRFAGILTKGPIIIEDDVWIGANCTITDGVRVRTGSVIAANSCVTGDVESYTIYGGVPAKKIGIRK